MALKVCCHKGCPELIDAKKIYCDKHNSQQRADEDRRRGTAAQRGYDNRWAKASRLYRSQHPLCECDECELERRNGRPGKASEVVDHIVPHGGNERRFWDEENWQALSHACHNRKTNRERAEGWA